MSATANEIPPMTDRLGRFWEAPDRSEIVIDDTHALMTLETYNKLLNYERSFPSGVYEGKMWRRDDLLVWYGPSPKPDTCSVHQREILIVEG